MNNPLTILIIDDSADDREHYVRSLRKMPQEMYRCLEAPDGRMGLEIIDARPIDCVLLDYSLPGMNGIEVLKKIYEKHPFTPVILLTGQGNETVAAEAIKQGAQDYIPKKVLTATALKRAVERAVERSEMIRRVEQYRQQLERSNSDLEQFAHIVAHDLKAPLRAITQHLTLIADKHGESLDEKSKRSIMFAVEGAARMRMLIEALFEYARLGFSEPQFDAVNLEVLLEQTKNDLSSIIEERSAVITHDALPEVKGDSILIAQLLQNLIGNAIKYCRETPKIHISATPKEDRWQIRVKDNGIGIPVAHHQQIFTIFRRLHVENDYPGIGLGLAICDRIVKQHGGLIEVDSEPGKGACFSFTLPATIAVSTQAQKVAHG